MESTSTSFSYGRAVSTKLPFGDAIDRAKQYLQDEGFGVLCEIDVAKTMQEKLGVDHEPYTILGTCNPAFAHQALSHDSQIGLLLPCNVVVQRSGESTTVSAIDARAMMQIVDPVKLEPIAVEVNARLGRVLDRIANAT